MAAPRSGGGFAKAAAEAKRVIRRAGMGWNKHNDAALDSGLRRARQHGAPSMHFEYGCVRMRFDFVPMAVQLADVKRSAPADEGSGDSDIEMRDSQSATAGQPADDAAAPAASNAAGSQPSAQVASATEMQQLSDQLADLSAKDSKRREARQRQRKNKRARVAAAKAAAAQAAAPAAAPAFTFVASAVSNSPAAAPAAAGAFTWPPSAPVAAGGTAPGLPAAFGAATSSSMPPGLAPAASGACPGQANEAQAFVPAFGGHMPFAEACLRLSGAISHASLSKARLQCVPRFAVFPGDKAPRRELMLRGGSAAAGMTEKELGAMLASMVDGGLTAESLHGALISGPFAPPPLDWEAPPAKGSFC